MTLAYTQDILGRLSESSDVPLEELEVVGGLVSMLRLLLLRLTTG